MVFARLAMRLRASTMTQAAALSGAAALASYTYSATHCSSPAATDWPKLKADLMALCDDDSLPNPSVDGVAKGSLGGGGFVAPMLVRLAWHSSGSYAKATDDGGSQGGTIRFQPEINHGGNAGLKHAIGVLAPIKENYPSVSWADLIIYAGVVAIEAMGGPVIGFTPGRSDASAPNVAPSKDKRFTPDDRLPDAAQKQSHLRDVFYRMGFDDREIVCLSGAHAVGRCHTDRSGFWGPWTYAENAFSNEYFKFLLEKTWTVKKTHEGKPWTGPKQYEADGGALMMLPSDLALIEDAAFKRWVEVYAKDESRFFADFAVAFRKLTELGFKPEEAVKRKLANRPSGAMAVFTEGGPALGGSESGAPN